MQVLDIMNFDLSEVQTAVGPSKNAISRDEGKATFARVDIVFTGISTDTRTIQKGDLFFALVGDNFDGHNFVEEAFARGAIGVVVKENYSGANARLIYVQDTLIALGDLAKYYRKKYDPICIAVTGSNGKTTTKEMLAACLGKRFSTLKTSGNLNNLIGLPLTLFNLDESYQAAVFELGMSYPGEIARLTQISSPQMGVFTNIAPVHLESMGTVEAVAKAKYELIENLSEKSTVILNIDDIILAQWQTRISQKIVTYGIHSKADYKVESIKMLGNGTTKFTIAGSEYQIGFPGIHNVYNAAAAIAAASSVGCNEGELVEALANLKPNKLRSEIFESAGSVFINDCYNANPTSMKFAVDMLAEYPKAKRKIAVLADMLELGENDKSFHREIGKYLTLNRIDALFAYGKLAEIYIENFEGIFKMHFTSKKLLALELKDYIKPGDVILIKGSRGMALEEISDRFRGNS